MNVLLLRPDPGNERFGLGPFFRVEPLGLEYIAAALLQRGHQVALSDLRFPPRLATCVRRARPQLVGISCMHALEYDRVLETARAVRRLCPSAFILVGGHAAAAFPAPLEQPAIDAICTDDGEEVVPMLVAALEGGQNLATVPALRLRTPDGFVSTPPLTQRTSLDRVPLPARHLIDPFRPHYLCLNFRPVWLVETARGCPFRCSFCSVWQLYDRSFRERSIGAVVEDMASVGPHVFVADDLFWNHPARSLELAHALRRRGVRKRWMLVQSRTDLVARHPQLLEAWRPVAELFDIFFGLEAASDAGLASLQKDNKVNSSVEAARVARALGYGVTGNFVIDPDWEEAQFHELWDFVERHGFQRAGFTILTPLPGTALYEQMAPQLAGQPWWKYDMHHLLWEPRLGARRFFELYAETWRRSVLNLSGRKRLRDWMAQVRLRDLPQITHVLLRTQRLMQPAAYLREHQITTPSQRPRALRLQSNAARDLVGLERGRR
ncbi:MAG: radical SAM protein [Myxococcales bacterium]|nr:B12-binding domain-containing radical SAM protein [Myxococcota bacterium]MDW8282594.1 radical SAM protein [Myxococcales bacterium]